MKISKEKNLKKDKTNELNFNSSSSGITLVALVVTIIVLLILAGISLSGVLNQNGIFKRAEGAGEKYNEAKARETLETILMTDGQYEKRSNPKYDQNEFLNNLITTEIPGARIIEGTDIAVIGEKYAFELDRSVPKIGRYLGKEKDLVWPTLNATVTLAEDKKDATIAITASEGKQGINKIEIWLLGEMIEKYEYNPAQNSVTVEPPYTTTQNGEYTIKAYGNLTKSKTVEVAGIAASVKFEPNGNEEWKKGHQTTVKIEETADRVVNSRYVWTNSVSTPEDDEFLEDQSFISSDTITENSETLTGTYYLWTMLTTQSGEKVKRRSEGFNFDNEGPRITSFTVAKHSIDGITLTATAIDTEAGTVKFEFYVEDKLIDTQTCTATTLSTEKSKTITGLTPGSYRCEVKVYDDVGNDNNDTSIGETKKYAWTRWNSVPTHHYTAELTGNSKDFTYSNTDTNYGWSTSSLDVSKNGDGFSSGFTHCLASQLYNKKYIVDKIGSIKDSVGPVYLLYEVKWYNRGSYSTDIHTQEWGIVDKPTFSMGSAWGTVTSFDKSAYVVGDRQPDGYYYTSIEPQ